MISFLTQFLIFCKQFIMNRITENYSIGTCVPIFSSKYNQDSFIKILLDFFDKCIIKNISGFSSLRLKYYWENVPIQNIITINL